MPPKAKKQEAIEISPVPAEKTDTTDTDLLGLYFKERAKQRSDLTEFTHAKYESWLHYFGFSLEQELRWGNSSSLNKSGSSNRRSSSKKASFAPLSTAAAVAATSGASSKTIALPPIATAASSSKPHAHSSSSKEITDPFATNAPIDDSSFTIPFDLAAADERALSIGPLSQILTISGVVDALVQPYKTVTWRQSKAMCSHMKVRVVYRWLCEHFKVTAPVPKGATATLLTADNVAPGSPAGAKKPAATKKGGGAADGATTLVPALGSNSSASLVTLVNKSGDAAALAQLFTEMLQAADITCEAVKGTLKGSLDHLAKPVGFLPWAWNIVSLPLPVESSVSVGVKNDDEGTSEPVAKYLIDVALSCAHVNPPRPPPPSDSTASSTATANAAGATLSAANTSSVASSVKFNELGDYSKVFEPWYYFTNPQHFASLHYPEDVSKLMLSRVVTRTHWEVYPRLNHIFYKNSIQLDSHKRRTVFTAKSTPIYVSFSLEDPQHTDMSLLVFRGGVPASLNAASPAPIDPRFIWQQRQEAEKRITFCVMTPDVGLYTLVFGARSINNHVAVSEMPQSLFDVACTYQVVVNFVPVNEPMYPRQLVSTAIAKLVEPQNYKLLAGEQHFTVVPTSCNVLAVAVVNRIFKVVAPAQKNQAASGDNANKPQSQDGKKPIGVPKGGKAAPAPVDSNQGPPTGAAATVTAPPKVEIERSTYKLLQLDPERCVFSGSVTVAVGLIEIWIFFGDPTGMVVGKNSSGGGSNVLDAVLDRPGSAHSTQSNPPAAQLQAPGQAPTAAQPGSNPTSPLKGAASKGNISGAFHPAVTDIQVVKRIPAKELSLNEGKPLIQPPAQPDIDTPATLRLVTAVTDTARDEMAELVLKPLHSVGGYFATKPKM